MAATKNREPWLAVLWSRIWPGLGQIYAGARLRGLVFALGCAGLAIAAVLGLLGVAGLSISTAMGCVSLLLLGSVWSWFDAYGVTRRQNSAEFEMQRRAQKDPWLAVFWTTLFLGAGHLYLRRYLLGGGLMAIAVVSFRFGPWAALLLPFVAVHAYGSSPGVADDPKTKKTKRQIWKIVLVAWLLPIGVGAVPAFGLRTFVAEVRSMPSDSMAPTLVKGDRIVINKLAYRRGDPQRGDLVLFSPTEELQRQNFTDMFLKRVVALPGERVAVREGKVLVEGKALDEPYILELPDYEWGPDEVPAGEYFVLGDNRNNSYDSNYWGFVPRENCVGEATQRFWPVRRMGEIDS